MGIGLAANNIDAARGVPGRLTIGRLVFGLVAVLVLGVWAAALRDAVNQYSVFMETQRVMADNVQVDRLLAAGRSMLLERGHMALRLSAPGPADQGSRDLILRSRHSIEVELAACLPHLRGTEELRAALAKLEALRPRADQALSQALADRDPVLRKEWVAAYGEVLHELADSVRDTALPSSRGVIAVRRLTRVKLWALELRRVVGEEAVRIGDAAATGRPLLPAELMALSQLRGIADMLSAEMRTEMETIDNPRLLATQKEFRDSLRQDLRPLLDQVLNGSLTGAPQTVPPQHFATASAPVLEHLMRLMDQLRDETAFQALSANRAAARALTVHSALALTALGFGVAALSVLRRRLLKPLRRLRSDLRRLAQGDLDIAAIPPSHDDELGQMRAAINEFRDVLDERRALWNALPDFICFKDAEGRWQWINGSAATLFGLEDADYRGQSDEFVASAAPHLAQWLQSAAAADDVVRRDGTTLSREEVIADCHGDIHFFQVLRVPLFHSGRVCRGSVVLGRDVTDRRRTEIAMARLAQQNQLLLDCAGEGIIGLDTQGRIIFVNPAVERLTGWDTADMVGEQQHALMHDRHPDGAPYAEDECPIHLTLTDGETRHCERETFWRRDGTPLPVEFTVTPIREQDNVRGAVVIFRDIHARLTAEQEIDSLLADLKRSNAELERFAYVASHDLRQPLRMINSYLTLLDRRMAGRLDGEEKEFIGFAVDGAQRMDRMILDLLEYSRIGRSNDLEPVRLGEVLDGALGSLHPVIVESGAVIDSPGELPLVQGVRSELERLFQNLLSNALKFKVEDRIPHLAITCRPQGEDWLITVADNGIGIDAKDHDRLFNIFQRLVPQTRYEGTGIGLASCRKIVEHHGGRIWIESQVGVGTTFLFTLPRHAPHLGE